MLERARLSQHWASRILRLNIVLAATAAVMLSNSGADLAAGHGRAPSELPQDPFGVYFLGFDQESLVGGEEMAQAGARWAQVFLPWRRIETSPGVYDWSRADALLGDAVQLGYQVIVYVVENPAWAADSVCGPLHQTHLQGFASFLSAAVARYSVAPYSVLHWQLYNEPDNGNAVDFVWLGGCWGRTHPNHAPGASGAAYAAVLEAVYPAMKAANPAVQVLLGGLAYDNWYHPVQNPTGPFDPFFLDELLYAGGGDYFDVINFHYYPAWSWVWDTHDRYTSNIYGKANYLSTQVKLYTGQTKPVMVTEVGLPWTGTTGPTSASGLIHPNRVAAPGASAYTDEEISRALIQAFVRGMAYGLEVLVWFEAVDEPFLQHKYGLMAADLTPRPAYYSYATLTAELSGADFVANRRDLPLHVEGYDFEREGRTKTVLWHLQEQPFFLSLALDRPGGILRVTDKFGNVMYIADGSEGDSDSQIDGRVTVKIDANPRFVEDAAFERIFMPLAVR